MDSPESALLTLADDLVDLLPLPLHPDLVLGRDDDELPLVRQRLSQFAVDVVLVRLQHALPVAAARVLQQLHQINSCKPQNSYLTFCSAAQNPFHRIKYTVVSVVGGVVVGGPVEGCLEPVQTPVVLDLETTSDGHWEEVAQVADHVGKVHCF